MEKPRSSKNPGLVEIGSIRVDPCIEQQRGECWKDCLSNQFPVTSYETVGHLSVFTVGAPHEGYTIETHLVNNKMNGESRIISDEEIKVAELFFQDGIANGPCTLYDSSGVRFFTGRFVDGYRTGRGKEYDTQGTVVFDGFFRLGKKMKLFPLNEMKGYWKELASVASDDDDYASDDDNDYASDDDDDYSERVINISKRDNLGRKEGICYQFNREGKITRVSKWSEDREVCLIKQFIGDQMIEYENGVKQYEGEFVDSLVMNYKRHGNGIAYEKNGKAVKYKGEFCLGTRHGKGISYRHREVVHNGEWMYGMPKPLFYAVNGLLIFLGAAVVAGICLLNYRAAIALLILWLLSICIYHSYILWLQTIMSRCGEDCKIAQILNNPDEDTTLTTLELTKRLDVFMFMKTIEIDDDCFESVQTFKIKGLELLKSVDIGENSFTQLKKRHWDSSKAKNQSRSFHILDCDSLESIQIGKFSFSDFGGGFELSNLKSLKSIQIGTIGSVSNNFCWSSFVIRGRDMILTIE